MVAGGVWDQPAAEWIARNQAAHYWEVYKKINAPGFDLAKAELTPAEKDTRDQIIAEQKRQIERKRGKRA